MRYINGKFLHELWFQMYTGSADAQAALRHPKNSVNLCCEITVTLPAPGWGWWQSSCATPSKTGNCPWGCVASPDYRAVCKGQQLLCCARGELAQEASQSGQQSPPWESAVLLWLNVEWEALCRSTFLKTNSNENCVWGSVCLPT